MRMPRVRFTIRRLMIAVLVAGLAMWGMFETQRRSQRITEKQAEASYKQAILVREVAEYAIKEYEQGIYGLDKMTSGPILLSRSDQDRAIDRLKWSREWQRESQGYGIDKPLLTDDLSREQAKLEREQAEIQRQSLELYTRAKQLKSLRSDLVKARADEQAKLATYQMERAKRLAILGF